MRILAINVHIDSALTALGHHVLSLTLPTGLHSIHSQPEVQAFQPDLLIQQESLGCPVVLLDISEFTCLKAFWSLDTHINLFWHRYYGRLFDCFLTPHTDFCAEAPAHWQHPYTRRLPFTGLRMPWRDHPARTHAMNFVGRVTEQRPMRQNFVQFLQQRYGMEVYQDISRAEMMQLYADTRLLPNETIAFESNFRLLEGASCGCCLISPTIGADQDAVLEPGKEVLVYSDALECIELIDLCLRKPHMAAAVGRMAWERVQADHLPQHRAVQLLQALADAPASALQGAKAQEFLWCSLAELELDGTFASSVQYPLWESDVHGTPRTAALRLRKARQGQNMPQCTALVEEALQILPQVPFPAPAQGAQQSGVKQEHAEAFMAEALATMSLNCLEQGNIPLAHTLWQRLHSCCGTQPPPVTEDSARDTPQPLKLALLWAEELYTVYGHWYLALEFLIFASKCGGKGTAWTGQWLRLAPMVRHFPLLPLAALARLCLNNEQDPPLHAAYIAANIRCFRVQEAQEELHACRVRWQDTPEEAQWQSALQQQCKHFHRLDRALQPFL